MEISTNKFSQKNDINSMIMELFHQGLSAQGVHDHLFKEFNINIVVAYLESIQNNLQNN